MALAIVNGTVQNIGTLELCALLSTATPFRYLNGPELRAFWTTGATPTEQPR